ncbi:hypothetical protein [Paraliomyxa miuraensis]|uniref:hypothetical protein n=1 Tax=Paraliomyxa miuraensis TaxID=376150 RepID=UPI00225B9F1B|nr:hypothetical protein [Paraliomyxa miuraensis]
MFDPDQYTTLSTRSARATLSLSRALLSAAPSRPTKAVARRLAWLRTQAERLQAAWIDLQRAAPAQRLRPIDLVLDRRWGSVRSRLDSSVQFGDDDSPRAQRFLELLFPTGLDFLTLPFHEQWAESERRLVRLRADDLEDELAELVGGKYLEGLQQAHADYGRALGITKAKEDAPEPTRVAEPLRELQAAIVSYARGVIGTMDERDEASVEAAKKQLEPILRMRRAPASGEASRADDENDEPVEQPLPELPVADVPEAAVA